MDPSKLLYAETHEWVSVDGAIATVGISKFAVDQLTDLIMIELPPVGKVLAAGKSFGEVESVKAVSDLYAPVGWRGDRGQFRRRRERPAPGRRSLRQGLADQAQDCSAGRHQGLMDFAAYEKKVAEEEH